MDYVDIVFENWRGPVAILVLEKEVRAQYGADVDLDVIESV